MDKSHKNASLNVTAPNESVYRVYKHKQVISIPEQLNMDGTNFSYDEDKLATVLCAARPFYSDPSRNCFEVLNPDEIVEYVVEFVRTINGILQLNTTITRMLLSHCKWEKDVLMEKFFDDADKLYKEAHVINPVDAVISATQSVDKECQICYAEMTPGSSAVSTCGHTFCTTCWSEYFKVKIMDEGVGNSIACAANDCNVIIDDEKVMELVDDSVVKLRYQKLITNSFVQKNKLLRWCPGRGCSFAFRVDSAPSKPMCCRCKCGTEICFDCGEEYHAPITCDLLGKFRTHTANTKKKSKARKALNKALIPQEQFEIKPCPNPRCQIQIAKNSGCHVMHCKNCGCVFCWNCLNQYKHKDEAYRHICLTNTVTVDTVTNTVTDDGAPEPDINTGLANQALLNYFLYHTDSDDDDDDDDDDEPEPHVARKLRRRNAINDRPSKRNRKVAPVRTTQSVENTAKDDTKSSPNEQVRAAAVTTKLDIETFTQNMEEDKQAWPFDDTVPSTSNGDARDIDRLDAPARIRMLRPNPRRTKYDYLASDDAAAVRHFVQNRKILLQGNEQWGPEIVEFELASLEWVRSCRTLKYFAVFDMYAVDVHQSALLKTRVDDLVRAVARLSKALTNVGLRHEWTYATIPTVLSPAFEICQLRRSSLLKYVDDGFDNEWWMFEEEPEQPNKLRKLSTETSPSSR